MGGSSARRNVGRGVNDSRPTFERIVEDPDRFAQSVRDRVQLLRTCQLAIAVRDGRCVDPFGTELSEAIERDDIWNLDRLVSTIEREWPQLFTLPSDEDQPAP